MRIRRALIIGGRSSRRERAERISCGSEGKKVAIDRKGKSGRDFGTKRTNEERRRAVAKDQ